MAEDATGGFDPNSVGGDRGGKALFDKLLGGSQPEGDKLMAYAQAVGMLAAPAVLFLFLNLCCCCCCTCCHSCFKLCCPNNCHSCKCTPRTDREYTKLEGILPVIVWTFISLLMCGFAIAGKCNVHGQQKIVRVVKPASTLNIFCFIFLNDFFFPHRYRSRHLQSE